MVKKRNSDKGVAEEFDPELPSPFIAFPLDYQRADYDDRDPLLFLGLSCISILCSHFTPAHGPYPYYDSSLFSRHYSLFRVWQRFPFMILYSLTHGSLCSHRPCARSSSFPMDPAHRPCFPLFVSLFFDVTVLQSRSSTSI